MNNSQVKLITEYPKWRAVEGLRELIREHYGAGDWLPAEIKLCEHFNVSRGTLRTALKLLEGEGLVRAQAGRGRVVTAGAETVSNKVMHDVVAIVTHESDTDEAPNERYRSDRTGWPARADGPAGSCDERSVARIGSRAA
jgi:DNA-binding transcriptional MocR family regulator